MKTKSFLRLFAFSLNIFLLLLLFTACKKTTAVSADAPENALVGTDEAASDVPSDETETEKVVLKGIVDLVPHSELIEFVRPILAKQGIEIDIVSTASDSTTNEKLYAGEIDFNFFQHEPYLLSENEANGFDLVSAGGIHVEPITAYSDKYNSVEDIEDGAVVAIPDNGTNEYRALRILEQQGFIKLNEETANSLSASLADVKDYLRPIEIVEINSDQIIPLKDDFDFFIVNTNKALEAKITSKKLFSEGADSPYANIIAVRPSGKDNPAIKALVDALRSPDTQKFIRDTYNGAVIPVD